MKQETVKITGRQKGRLLWRLHRLGVLVFAGVIPYDEIMTLTKELFKRYAPDELGDEESEPQNDEAEKRRVRFRNWIQNTLGFADVWVPKPDASNREYARRRATKQEIFFNWFRFQADYDAFMCAKAIGQAKHWTVIDQTERAKIGWEFTKDSYWFWAEVSDDCPRLGTSRNQLTADLAKQRKKLLSLEEYAIVWHATKAMTGKFLDRRFWCWLRTRYNGSGSLYANEYVGRVGVNRDDAEDLSVPVGSEGGRAAEVVKNAS